MFTNREIAEGVSMKKITRSKDDEDEIKRILASHTTYDAFTKHQKHAYRVAELYNVKVCPYCNINYTYTVYKDNGFVCRPDFDHFELRNPQNELQIDNLIPSCQQCNSRVKHDKSFSKDTHIHPFFDDFDSLAEFLIDIEKVGMIHLKENFEILCQARESTFSPEKEKVENSIHDLCIKQRYSFHKDVVSTIIKHGYLYNKRRSEEIGELVAPNHSLIYAIYSLLFPDIDCDINQTSLGKLKRDISRKIKEYVSKKG